MRIVRKSYENTGPMLPGMEISEQSESTTSQPLTSSVAASPARISATQCDKQELRESDQDYGHSSTVSFASYDPHSSSWRTSQLSLSGELIEFSETYPRAGMMQNGRCYQQKPLVRHTLESESSLWP